MRTGCCCKGSRGRSGSVQAVRLYVQVRYEKRPPDYVQLHLLFPVAAHDTRFFCRYTHTTPLQCSTYRKIPGWMDGSHSFHVTPDPPNRARLLTPRRRCVPRSPLATARVPYTPVPRSDGAALPGMRAHGLLSPIAISSTNGANPASLSLLRDRHVVQGAGQAPASASPPARVAA